MSVFKKASEFIFAFVILILGSLFWIWIIKTFFKLALYLWGNDLSIINRLGTPSVTAIIFINNLMIRIFGDWANEIASIIIFGMFGFLAIITIVVIIFFIKEIKDLLLKFKKK